MTFDDALAGLLALVGERVEVHAMDAGETSHLVATFGGRLQAGYSMTGGDPSDTEAIFDTEVQVGGLARRRPAAVGSEAKTEGEGEGCVTALSPRRGASL
jgi:hypothetical protein